MFTLWRLASNFHALLLYISLDCCKLFCTLVLAQLHFAVNLALRLFHCVAATTDSVGGLTKIDVRGEHGVRVDSGCIDDLCPVV